MSMVRLRRLDADYRRLHDFVSRHPRLQLIQAIGNPPERYQIEYRIKSLRQKDGQLEYVNSHLVEIVLPLDYPRIPPLCRMLTPVFHPNIAPHAICIGDHWSAGESLSALVARIGEILSYQSYNTRSPLNGEAAKWVDENIPNLPLDPVSMTVEETSTPTTPPPPTTPVNINTAPPTRTAPPRQAPPPQSPPPVRAAPAPPQPEAYPEPVEFLCPTCHARMRLKYRPTTSLLRCPKCQNLIDASGL